MDFSWTTDSANVVHVRKIDSGAFGEVHEVSEPFRNQSNHLDAKFIHFRSKKILCRLQFLTFDICTKTHSTQVTEEDIRRETDALRRLQANGPHLNIVTVFNWNELKASPYHAIDMELCDLNLERYILGGYELGNQMSKCPGWPNLFEPNQFEWMQLMNIWRIAENIACGLAYIHNFNLVHRDLKPANSPLLLQYVADT